jgi:uncharacterized protein YbjT (DUF2867 family)
VILVAGATGNVGGELVAQLAQAGAPVRGVVRAASASLPDGATVVVGDLNDPGSLAAALEGIEAMFTGPEPLTAAQRVAILGEALGQLSLVAQSDVEARAEMSHSTPPEYVHAFFSFYADGMLDESELHSTVTDVTGRAPRSFRVWAQAHAGAFG